MLLKVKQGGVKPRHDAKIEPSTMLLLVSFLKAINAALKMDGAAVPSHHVMLFDMGNSIKFCTTHVLVFYISL